MSAFEPFEELHFAKVDGSKNYAFIHSFFTGKLLSAGKSQYRTNVNYNEFCLYLAGASFAKDTKKFHLYNGMPSAVIKSFFPNMKLSCLENGELEKLLLDTKLTEEFKDKIKTIN